MNKASLSKIIAFYRIGKGTVDLITQRIITAITSSNFILLMFNSLLIMKKKLSNQKNR